MGLELVTMTKPLLFINNPTVKCIQQPDKYGIIKYSTCFFKDIFPLSFNFKIKFTNLYELCSHVEKTPTVV